jgi:rhamnogalacturonyl hydrolase YesR
MKQILEESIKKLEKWVEDHNYKGYEPFDGLLSYLRPLTLNNLFCERLLQQLVRQSPVNLRPLLGIRPQESTKGRGYMAWGYLTMFRQTGQRLYLDKAAACLDWLMNNKAPGHSEYSWGNHFDFSSRSGRIPKLEPIIVWTSSLGQAFLDAYEIIGDKKYLEVASSICNWIMALPREVTDSGACLSYVMYEQSSIHNSNLLGAAMLARTASHTGDQNLVDVAGQAVLYSCTRQRPYGSWWYGEEEKYHWIDNFHTGYNLDSLKCYLENTSDQRFAPNLKAGFEYFMDTFFEENGRPKYYHSRVFPVDIQCASQGIETLAKAAGQGAQALETAIKVALWTIDNMQDKSGHFYYRLYPWGTVKTPMLHWGQATMYKALSTLLYRIDSAPHELPRDEARAETPFDR